MSLTQCPDCRRLSFVSAASCPSCAREFRPGALRAKFAEEERAFGRRSGALFLAALMVMTAVLFFVVLRG